MTASLVPLFVALSWALGAPSPTPRPEVRCHEITQGYGPEGTTPIRVEKWVGGLEIPWGMAFLPGGDLLVTERPGRIRLIQRGGKLVPEPVARVDVKPQGEGGLLGIALDPDFPRNRFLYLYLTTEKQNTSVNRVQRFVLSPDSRSARPDQVILDDLPAAAIHDGGRIHFGPDRRLYVSTGDARTPSQAQDLARLGGKLLRIGTDGKPEVVIRGLRNPQGFDWISSQLLAIADHGPSGDLGGRTGGDEINLAPEGANLGWPATWKCQAPEGVTPPVLTFTEASPPGGLLYYRADAIPAWKNSLLVTGLGSRLLQRIKVSEAPPFRSLQQEIYLHGEPPTGYGRLRDLVQGPDGAVYISTSNCDGRGVCPEGGDQILKITAG